MAGFLKILLRNVLEGPSTDPFPLGETFTPKRFRGKVVLNPDLCMGCGICRHTCAAGAINIHVRPDQSGYDFTVWHNSCCLCASCRHYCPTGAITLTTDWHNAHAQEEKFTWLEQKFVPYIPCEGCGTPMRPTPLSIAKKIYINNSDVDIEKVIKLCPKCRQIEDARKHSTPLPQTGEEAMESTEGKAMKAEAQAPTVDTAAPEKIAAPEKNTAIEKSATPEQKDAAPKLEAVETKAEAKAEAAPAPKPAASPTPEDVLEKTLTLAEPQQPAAKAEAKAAPKAEAQASEKPEATTHEKPAKAAPAPADKPAEKPAAPAASKAAPAAAQKTGDTPKAQAKPASAQAKNKSKAKGKKTK